MRKHAVLRILLVVPRGLRGFRGDITKHQNTESHNISEINFNNSDYLLAGKYLDSALMVMENNSKEFWKYDRQRKGLEKVVNLTEKVIYWDSLLTISNYSKEKLEKVLTQVAIQNSSLGKNEGIKKNMLSKFISTHECCARFARGRTWRFLHVSLRHVKCGVPHVSNLQVVILWNIYLPTLDNLCLS